MDTLEKGLQAELNEISPCCYTMKIVVPAAEVSKVYSDVLTKYIANVRMPGFRAGHTPKALVIKSHGADIKADATQNLLNEGLDAAFKKYELEAAGQVSLKDDKMPELDPKADLTFELSFEAFAKFDLPEYSGMAIENPEETVDEKKVDEAMDTFIHSNGNYQKVERAAATGDMLKVDFKALDAADDVKEDKSASYLLNGENSWVVLREGAEMLPGITTIMAGMNAGDEKDAAVVFPEDFRCKALCGKTINYHFALKEVHGYTAPELNEELFKRYGCKTEDEMRGRIRDRIQMSNRQTGYAAMVEQITNKLLTSVDFPLPPTLVEKESQELVKSRLEAKRHEKTTEEELAEMLPQLESECKAEVSKNIKLSEILNAIAKAEKAQVNDYDIYQYCAMVAQEHGMDIQEVIKKVREDRNILRNIIQNVTTQKGLNAIFTKANITYTDPTTAAAKAAEKAAAEAAKAAAAEDAAKNEAPAENK